MLGRALAAKGRFEEAIPHFEAVAKADDPRQQPLYPQKYAELMAGRRLLAPDRWRQPASLDEVVVGPATALEIRWVKTAD